MKTIEEKRRKLYRRRMRVRAKIRGAKIISPRLSVYRSLNHIYAQIIDDEKGATLVSASDRAIIQEPGKKSLSKKDLAFKVGELIAERALRRKIQKVVFDRGGRVYHGRVKAVAEGSRQGGLKF